MPKSPSRHGPSVLQQQSVCARASGLATSPRTAARSMWQGARTRRRLCLKQAWWLRFVPPRRTKVGAGGVIWSQGSSVDPWQGCGALQGAWAQQRGSPLALMVAPAAQLLTSVRSGDAGQLQAYHSVQRTQQGHSAVALAATMSDYEDDNLFSGYRRSTWSPEARSRWQIEHYLLG